MVVISCSWNCTADWAGILLLSSSAKPKQTKRFLISTVRGPSAAQVITQNKTVLQALCTLTGFTTASRDALHKACPSIFSFFLLCSFSVLPKAVLFPRLSLSRDYLMWEVQVFKANVTIQAEEQVICRETIFEALTHFKWHIHFCNFPAISTWRTSFCIPLNSSNTLNSPWTSGVQMNA